MLEHVDLGVVGGAKNLVIAVSPLVIGFPSDRCEGASVVSAADVRQRTWRRFSQVLGNPSLAAQNPAHWPGCSVPNDQEHARAGLVGFPPDGQRPYAPISPLSCSCSTLLVVGLVVAGGILCATFDLSLIYMSG